LNDVVCIAERLITDDRMELRGYTGIHELADVIT
jgi:hypothetical protein